MKNDNNSTYHLKLVEHLKDGSVIVHQSIETNADALSVIDQITHDFVTISQEYETLKSDYVKLRNTYENITQRNAAMLASFTSILANLQVYDAQKNTINLYPLLKPYFALYQSEINNEANTSGFFAQRWQEFIINNNLDGRGLLVKAASKAVKILINYLTKKSKQK